MSVSYFCPHLDTPHPPYPPSYPSSSTSFSPLPSLYFCEECDAVRCDQCVAIEVASYYCPNCLFDVPSANVRGDKNRCARSCFSCPHCTAALQVIATDATEPGSSTSAAAAVYLLSCTACKWSSKEVGWQFEKGTSIAMQLQKMMKEPQAIQDEFEMIKDHVDSYITTSAPAPTAAKSALSGRQPTRHISHLTQMAAKALGRDVPGMRSLRTRQPESDKRAHESWDELGEYKSKGSWKVQGLERGMSDVETMRQMAGLESARLEHCWASSWDKDKSLKSRKPERIPLQTKLTKRCPEGSCRHLLVQPDTKTTRFKIKNVASTYLPEIEVGRRRRRLDSGTMDPATTPEEIEKRRRERRKTRGKLEEEDEDLSQRLKAGQVYTYQMAFVNPLYDLIQIRLTQPRPPPNAPPVNHHLHIPTQHFTVAALKDAWAYDEEEEDEDILPALEGSEGYSEEGSTLGTLGRKSRKSVLGGGSSRDKKRGEPGVEKKGNISKVGVEIEISPEGRGAVEFDLEVRYTYRADDASDKEKESKSKREEYKTFTYWIRVHVGDIE